MKYLKDFEGGSYDVRSCLRKLKILRGLALPSSTRMGGWLGSLRSLKFPAQGAERTSNVLVTGGAGYIGSVLCRVL